MDLKTLTAEALTTLRAEKKTTFDGLVALESPTKDQYDQAFALADEIKAIDTEFSERQKFADLKNVKFAGDEQAVEQPAEQEKPEEEAPAEEPAEEKKPEGEVKTEVSTPATEVKVEEPAQASTSNVAALAAKGTTRPVAPATSRKTVTITAAADVPQFSAGQTLDSLDDVAMAVINRARGFAVPHGDGRGEDLRQFGTAMFSLEGDEGLIVNDPHEAQDVFHRAANESRLPGGSLVAAGGWCAPSETMYDLSQDATADGLLSLPEVVVNRGGIRYAQSPVFADFYANPGFKQTEAQAIAGNTKPCIDIPCPSFTEVRLDAVGLCIKVPILTNAAYPEVVRNFIAGTQIAHQHWVNADIIGRLVTAAGTARDFTATGLGSTASDTLEAMTLVIDQERQRYRLSLNATVEVVVPFWVKGAMKVDIARRNGRSSAGAVSDQELAASFPNANVQYVYDWQALPLVDNSGTTGVNEYNTYPATFQALVYPAGTFVKGTAPVINLNTVYDAASLAVNTYTGLFMEQGLLVAQMKFGARLLTLPVCNAGRQGALDFTCA